jgi:hypothetical protein
MSFRLTTRPAHPTFTDLPWEEPLENWATPRLVSPARGISRHCVRFVAYGPDVYALKELPPRYAEREYRLLRELSFRNVPVVEAVGIATGREDMDGNELDAVLITRHLMFALPYRTLFSRAANAPLWPQMLDAMVELLVRIHVAGFFWGDCSLNNTLFRRDAGALAAWLVDAETGEVHEELSRGQRLHDLSLAQENVAGDLFDIMAAGLLADEIDPADVAQYLEDRYDHLWAEVTREQILPTADRWVVDERVNRLNELGYDVREIELVPREDGWHLRLQTQVVEPGHHRRRLLALTGLDVGENQARRLLNDFELYRMRLERRTHMPVAEQVGALRWLTEEFEPTLALIPADQRGKLEDAEHYHQILEHRWFRSEQAGRDIGRAAAVGGYVDEVLHELPDEKVIIDPHATTAS